MNFIPLAIREAALPAWHALQAAIAERGPTPCADRDEWTSDDPRVRAYAAGHCARCPVLAECAAFADANHETRNVWAGTDRTPKVKHVALQRKPQASTEGTTDE